MVYEDNMTSVDLLFSMLMTLSSKNLKPRKAFLEFRLTIVEPRFLYNKVNF